MTSKSKNVNREKEKIKTVVESRRGIINNIANKNKGILKIVLEITKYHWEIQENKDTTYLYCMEESKEILLIIPPEFMFLQPYVRKFVKRYRCNNKLRGCFNNRIELSMIYCTGEPEQPNIRQESLEKPEVLNILFSTF